MDAFNQNLNQLFLELAQVSELLSDHADSVLDNPVTRKAQRHGSQMAWYRYEPLDDEEDAYDQSFTAASRQWLNLQL